MGDIMKIELAAQAIRLGMLGAREPAEDQWRYLGDDIQIKMTEVGFVYVHPIRVFDYKSRKVTKEIIGWNYGGVLYGRGSSSGRFPSAKTKDEAKHEAEIYLERS